STRDWSSDVCSSDLSVARSSAAFVMVLIISSLIRCISLRFRQNAAPLVRKQARELDQIFSTEYFPQRAVALQPMIRSARLLSPAPARYRSRLLPLVRQIGRASC